MGFFPLITVSDSSLLGYSNATDFCVLTLYPATLPLFVLSCNSFLAASLGFSMCGFMSLANRQFYFFLWNLDSFCFLSLIPLANTSKTILNKSDESQHTCLIPDFRGNAFTFEH